ncbi:mercuric transporter MerT family protein [Sphingobium sp. YG1]|jgi:mercuric ion transport protein|uniref:mercuric transporter MerT family protein n=1 Tax=Sphingobium sp. YG1 TaxID=2082188 RepID=UPI000DBB7C60|nr:mercuric transporter MerT family protein [Sphingobium sp. YG1]BBD02198.1 mercuric ion transport protein [Sphingobium sp. YG1]
MISKPYAQRHLSSARGALLLAFGAMASAFGVASCCALPILLTTVGVSVGWLGGIAVAAAPYRTLLLGLSALSLVGGAIMLWRQQRVAMTCGPDGACTPPALRAVVFVGLTVGAILLWLGYSYV